MSFQAVTWAIQQKTGGTSGKAALLSIANYAGENWCSWPSQTTVADESEQSVDSVQRRYRELEKARLLRRIPMKHGGRKTVDFLILAPSPLFAVAIDDLEPNLPRGCEIDRRAVAADCGSDKEDTPADSQGDQPPQSEGPQSEGPQVAATVTAMVRQQEPATEPKIERERAREASEAEPHVPDADLLDGLKLKHPNAAHDSQADIEAEWRKLTRPERREAAARFDGWLAAKGARRAIAGLPAYLREKRWTLIAQVAEGTASAMTPAAAAFHRSWWWLFHDFATCFAHQLANSRSAASQHLRDRVSLAQRHGIGWKLDAGQSLADIEVKAEAMVKLHRDGAEAAAWRDRFRDRGIDMPFPDVVEWLWAPSQSPPDEPDPEPLQDAEAEA